MCTANGFLDRCALDWIAAAPDEWTVVPLLVKVYKLVINELSNQIEKSTSTRATTGDEDEVFVVVYFDFMCIFCSIAATPALILMASFQDSVWILGL